MAKRRSPKSKKQSQTPTEPRPLLIERLADASLIASLFMILAFAEIRFEGFETEKAAILPIFGGIILASHIARFARNHHIPWGDLFLNPVIVGVIGVTLVSLVSSIFSLSPARSWIGEAERLSGLLTFLVYILIFRQAVFAYRRLTPLLMPILITVGIPMSLSVYVSRFSEGIDRPGSTTGNPNYLSGWIAMVLIILGVQLFIQFRRWERPYSFRQWATLALVLGSMLVMLGAVFVVRSRAALLSLGLGSIVTIALVLVIAQQRRLLMGFFALTLIGGTIYGIISLALPQQTKNQIPILRVFHFGDSRRNELWTGALSVISQQADPMFTITGEPDPNAGIRPLIGYGLSVIPQTQGRFGATTHQNQFVGSYHNLIYDTIVMIGSIGVTMWAVVYLGAMYAVQKVLGVIRESDLWFWLGFLAISSILGILIIPSLFPNATTTMVLPIGASLGIVFGNFLWIIGQFLRLPKEKPTELFNKLTDTNILLAGLLGVMIARWVDLQFGFVQSASEPLWWTLLGIMVGWILHHEKSDEPDTEAHPIAKPIHWQLTTLTTGVLIFYGFGNSILSAGYNHTVGLDRIILLVVALVIVGYLGAMVAVRGRENSLSSLIGGLTIVLWIIMAVFKQTIASTSGTLFDNAINPISAESLPKPFFLLSLVGVMMVIFVLLSWTFGENRRFQINQLWSIALASILFLAGLLYYMSDYTSSTLHFAGTEFLRQNEVQPLEVADNVLEAGIQLDPTNARMRIHWVATMTQLHILAGRPDFVEDINQNVQSLFVYEPYFNNTIEWQQFADFYETNIGLPLASALSSTD